MKSKLLLLPLLLIAISAIFHSCDDDETYADKRKRENKQINAFLKSGAQVKNEDTEDYILNIPGNIKVISENEFYSNDSTTNVKDNEYVYFSNSGVYMQIVDKGSGKKLADGETSTIITRYTEFNIATDSIQTSNKVAAHEMKPDIMMCSNSLGNFTASFSQGVMMDTYDSAAVPAGWLIPLTYINLGRLDSATASLAHVRLIVPSAQGQANASSLVYPCFYEITYQRGK